MREPSDPSLAPYVITLVSPVRLPALVKLATYPEAYPGQCLRQVLLVLSASAALAHSDPLFSGTLPLVTPAVVWLTTMREKACSFLSCTAVDVLLQK